MMPLDDDLQAQARAYLRSCPRLPLPGGGDTLGRWRALAAIAGRDVCLVKILEAHFDALAILAELGGDEPGPEELWAVWAAEPPAARIALLADPVRLDGTKAWCSGAAMVDRALLTAHAAEGPQLAILRLRQPGIQLDDSEWQAIGMGRVVSGKLHVDAVAATALGAPGAYTERPGFWHGGAGIAACWFGAAVAIADALRLQPPARLHPHALAHLGRLDMDLSAAAALLRETAALIDRLPQQAHRREVLRLRSCVERVCGRVLEHVGRALGATPLCSDLQHAQRCADLSVFIRQSHAERDWAELGTLVAEQAEPWRL